MYTVDAQNETIGRVASKAAVYLMGKTSPEFRKNKKAKIDVTIINASKLRITPKKLKQKQHISYSGYPGGLKRASLENVLAKKGASEVLKLAVYGMLPHNKLTNEMMKCLTITE